jgi:AraC family transcriptional regulator
MSNITSIFEAVESVEKNLKEEITIADIADAVYYSLYHFCRTFNAVIHHTPYDYLMRRRLSESARELVETNKKIIDIAMDYRFNSPETYSRAFKRMLGMQPNQWRKQGKLDKRLLMSRLTLDHIKHRNKGDFLKPVSIKKDAFQVAGIMTLANNDPTVISHLWELLGQVLAESKNTTKAKPGNYYGISWYPKDWQQHGFLYLAANEMQSQEAVNPALVVKTIPSLTYARFIHKGPGKDIKLTLDYIYQTWLPKSGKNLCYPLEIEHYGGNLRDWDSEESQWEVYIPVK